MKKNEVKKLKKLRLSRETLQVLASPDVRKVVGGSEGPVTSCITGGCGGAGGPECPTPVGFNM
jgi:hypothetical protein